MRKKDALKKCEREKVKQERAQGNAWHRKPTKDVTSCEKLRGVANKRRSAGIRMGNPAVEEPSYRYECIVSVRELGELNHLSTRRKREKDQFPQ